MDLVDDPKPRMAGLPGIEDVVIAVHGHASARLPCSFPDPMGESIRSLAS